MKVLLLGAAGQLASDIRRLWTEPDLTVVPATRADAELTDAAAVDALVGRVRPDVVINTAAFHAMAVCEQDPATTFNVNVVAGGNVARAAAEVGAAIVQISTDYVFDGAKAEPYIERDERRALNVYGASKIAIEDLVGQVNPEWAVIRVSGLYGLAGSAGKGGNFVETMLRLAAEGNPIRVVADQVTAPTNTAEIAEALLPIVRDGGRGVFHLAAGEGTTWHAFAQTIFARCGLSPDLQPVTTEELGGPVRRPLQSVLRSTRAPQLRGWRDGLDRYLREKGRLA
jgi:dTDP-4-dehydrorhamnose reductase